MLRWVTDETSSSGIISDGRTHVVILGGNAAVVTTHGKVSITHRFRNLLNPSSFDIAGWNPGEAVEGEIKGRDAWIVESLTHLPGKIATLAGFDRETGILLALWGGEQRTRLEELEVNPSLDEDVFRWNGPIEPRPIGVAYVDEKVSAWAVSWQVQFPELAAGYQLERTFPSKDEAFAWAKERAIEIVERD